LGELEMITFTFQLGVCLRISLELNHTWLLLNFTI